MEVCLSVIAGPHQGREFRFERHDSFLVGRSKQAHFRLPQKDPYFSRLHFLIEVNPPLCRLVEMGSTNGTRVNQQAIDEAVELRAGDVIEAGDTLFRVAIDGDSTTPNEDSAAPIVFEAVEATLTLSPESLAARSNDDANGSDADNRSAVGAEDSEEADSGVQPASNEAVPLHEASTFVPQHWPAARKRRVPLIEVASADRGAATPHRNTPADDLPVPIRPDDKNLAALLPENYEALARKLDQTIPGYLLVDELGRGGMGIVYRAICQQTHSAVAIKTISPAASGEQADYQRFVREADIHRTLIHPHIVRCRRVGEAQGLLFIVMDYIPGTDAKQLLKTHGPLPVTRAVNIVCQLLDALEFAHSRGYVHRDIKPSNLLVQEDGGRDWVYLADFGLARTYHESRLSGLTMTGDVGGTTPFMPPEQIVNYREAKPASDQYAAAAALYNLLTGKFVYDFPKQIARQLALILTNPVVPITERRSDLPARLVQAINKALSRNPESRFANVATFRMDIQRFASQ